jgi:hypothetical protein
MNLRTLTLALAFVAGIGAAAAAPAGAATFALVAQVGPVYNQWQPAWDRYEFDRHHVILGTVTHFDPFRLQIARPNGSVQMIDLKDGTVILPTGTTPMVNERVAVTGYYSHGTFIANRILIRA